MGLIPVWKAASNDDFMAEARVERRLAAILAADVAAYSRLMGIDEEGAALKTRRRELVDPKIAEHRGRIVKTTGNGALVEFPSAVDAVRCATDIQHAMAVAKRRPHARGVVWFPWIWQPHPERGTCPSASDDDASCPCSAA